jgi:Ca2+/Na+ antiporter
MTKKYTNKIRIHFESVVLWTECILLVVAFAVYVYFIASSVVHVVIKKEIAHSIHDTETKISKLESDYFKKTKEISSDIAEDYNLVAVAPVAYIDISDENGRLSRSD